MARRRGRIPTLPGRANHQPGFPLRHRAPLADARAGAGQPRGARRARSRAIGNRVIRPDQRSGSGATGAAATGAGATGGRRAGERGEGAAAVHGGARDDRRREQRGASGCADGQAAAHAHPSPAERPGADAAGSERRHLQRHAHRRRRGEHRRGRAQRVRTRALGHQRVRQLGSRHGSRDERRGRRQAPRSL